MNNQNLSSLISVIGTLAGTILGWILNSVSHIGKLKFYVNGVEHTYNCQDHSGNMIGCSLEDSEWFKYEIDLDIYNSSAIPKIIRNIKIQLYNNNEMVYENIPDDKSTARFSAAREWYNKIGSLTIQPKTVYNIVLRSTIDTRENKLLFNSMRLTYTNSKNRIKHMLIYKDN